MNQTAAAPNDQTDQRRRTIPRRATRVRRFFVMPHTAASSMRPPSRGNPGSAFKPAKISESHDRYPTMLRDDPGGRDVRHPEHAGEHQRRGRSDEGHQELAERTADVGPRLGRSAPEDERDPADRQAERARHDGVRGLVRQDAAKKSAAAKIASKTASPSPRPRPS